MKNYNVFVGVAFMLVSMFSHSTFAWWDDAWPYRLPITVDTTVAGADIKTDVDNAVVLVKLHSGNFQDFFLVNENLSDVRFLAADDATLLDYQLESFDLINQLIYIWVKIPKVSGNLNTERLWMYYGNTEAQPFSAQNPVYAPDVAAVFHFSETSGSIADGSAYGNNPSVAQTATNPSSMIAGGLRFGGSGGVVIENVNSLQLDQSNGFTVSFWVKPGQPADEAVLMSLGGLGDSIDLVLDQNQLYVQSTNIDLQTEASTSLKSDNWYHVALTVANDIGTLYLDGKVSSRTAGFQLPQNTQFTLGVSLAGDKVFVGEMDELRLDSRPCSEQEIKLQLASQNLLGNLLSYQQGEQLGSGGGGSGFWGIIIGSTEGSGWTIIALLGVMAAISWMVMLGKVLFLGAATKDNTAFLDQYRSHAGEDPAMLDHADTKEDKELEDSPILQALFGGHDHFQSSPIYRVYHRGIQEVTSRLGTSVGAKAAGLSPAAVNAIKASIDSQMIREAQRLNSKMVLLTIAIAGGPFLGLMGTVVGVMITFAAIAASGDVNISAIAPGVAAALLTTVAGLVVAIPALFGYNYLATKIKENIADMRVFADEFITRLAEYYGN